MLSETPQCVTLDDLYPDLRLAYWDRSAQVAVKAEPSRKRSLRHSLLGMVSPVEYELQYASSR